MIIDQTTPGLEEKKGYWELKKDLISTEFLEIKISLSVTG